MGALGSSLESSVQPYPPGLHCEPRRQSPTADTGGGGEVLPAEGNWIMRTQSRSAVGRNERIHTVHTVQKCVLQKPACNVYKLMCDAAPRAMCPACLACSLKSINTLNRNTPSLTIIGDVELVCHFIERDASQRARVAEPGAEVCHDFVHSRPRQNGIRAPNVGYDLEADRADMYKCCQCDVSLLTPAQNDACVCCVCCERTAKGYGMVYTLGRTGWLVL